MKIEGKHVRPSLLTFIKFLLLNLVLFFAITSFIYIYTAANPFDSKSNSLLSNFIFLPFIIALVQTFGSRKYRITITNADDETTKKTVVEIVTKAGMRIKDNSDSTSTFQNVKSFHRKLDHWFGTELLTMTSGTNEITVAGPYRKVNIVEWAFKDRPKETIK